MGASQVLVGAPLTGVGGILHAPIGTALPTSETTAPNAAFKPIGYVDKKGVKMKIDRKVEKIIAWGGDAVRVVQSEHAVEFEFGCLETNPEVLKLNFGASNVTVTAATVSTGTKVKTTLNSSTLDPEAFLIEIKDGNARIRVVIPNGQVTETSDVDLTHTEAIAYGVKLEALPDSLGNKAYIYSDDGVFA